MGSQPAQLHGGEPLIPNPSAVTLFPQACFWSCSSHPGDHQTLASGQSLLLFLHRLPHFNGLSLSIFPSSEHFKTHLNSFKTDLEELLLFFQEYLHLKGVTDLVLHCLVRQRQLFFQLVLHLPSEWPISQHSPQIDTAHGLKPNSWALGVLAPFCVNNLHHTPLLYSNLSFHGCTNTRCFLLSLLQIKPSFKVQLRFPFLPRAFSTPPAHLIFSSQLSHLMMY